MGGFRIVVGAVEGAVLFGFVTLIVGGLNAGLATVGAGACAGVGAGASA